MSTTVWRSLTGFAIWGIVLKTTLSISQLQVSLGHGICGPWGCGPPIQALIGCHLSWMVALIPMAFICQKWLRPHDYHLVGVGVTAFGCACILMYVTYDISVWWPKSSDIQHQYWLQRIGFAIATEIDLPLIEFVTTGLCVLILEKMSTPRRIRDLVADHDSCTEIHV